MPIFKTRGSSSHWKNLFWDLLSRESGEIFLSFHPGQRQSIYLIVSLKKYEGKKNRQFFPKKY